MIKRKYFAEGGLELFSSPPSVVLPSSIYSLVEDPILREELANSNIYIIVRRSRIRVDGSSLRHYGPDLSGHLLVQSGHDHERFPFSLTAKLADYITRVTVLDYPEDGVCFTAFTGESVKYPTFRFLGDCNYELDGNDDLEVLYIGQGYGEDGEILAIDRLKNHSMLQRILADTLCEKSDHEVLLLMFRFEHYKKHMSTAGNFSSKIMATSEQDKEYFETALDAKFSRFNRICLAEASLISFFKPRYNEIYKNTFPSKKQKILEELVASDYSALTVSVDTSNIRANLYSDSVRPVNQLLAPFQPFTQIVQIPLYSDQERESFLHPFL